MGCDKSWGAGLRDGVESTQADCSILQDGNPGRWTRAALLVTFTLKGLVPGAPDIQLRALAHHLVRDVFPALRQRFIKRIELRTSQEPGACLTSKTPGAPVYFPGTAALNWQLHTHGLASLRLAVDMDANQLIACIFLAKAPRRGLFTAGAGRAAGRALASPDGYTQFGVQARLVEGGAQLRARPAGGRGDTSDGLHLWNRRQRHAARNAAYHLAPFALLSFVLLLVHWQHKTLASTCLNCAACLAAAALYAGYRIGASAWVRTVQKRLLQSYWDGVNALNLKVQAQNRSLRQTNALKDTLLQVGSHDIRNPLVNIMLLSEAHLARSKRDVADPAKAWRVVHSEAERIRGIVENFMNLERIQQGRLSVERTSFDLAVVTREVLRARAAELEVRQLSVETAFAPGLPMAQGDPRHVVEVLHNYLGNAMKFSPAGSTIQIEVQSRGAHIRAKVRDNGPGVPAHLRHQLFQEFALIGTPSARGDMGTGLGLSIARKLVEYQGGAVGADFPENGGSNFWFELPAACPSQGSLAPELLGSSVITGQ